jgi:hypothetical protein
VRRQLFREKDQRERNSPGLEGAAERGSSGGTDLDELAKMLIELHRQGMRTEDVQILYAHHVLGYSIAELAVRTGRDRRALYARRDRGQRRICA